MPTAAVLLSGIYLGDSDAGFSQYVILNWISVNRLV